MWRGQMKTVAGGMEGMEICNCINQIEQRYRDHLIENDPVFKDIDEFEVGFKNKAYMLDSGKTELVIPIEVEWKHIAKSGRVSNKAKISNFTVDYCPFCGKKMDSGGTEVEDETL